MPGRFGAPSARSAELIGRLIDTAAGFDVIATTITSVPPRLYALSGTTITGRRFRDDKSVNGTGTRTMSPCSGMIPVLVVAGIVPEVGTARGGRQQIVESCLNRA